MKAVLVYCCPALLMVGCSQFAASRSAPDITGEWYATSASVSISGTETGVTTDSSLGTSDAPQIVIREDGSFDLSKTILGELKGIEDLRRVGDRVVYDDGTIKIKKSTYAPELSELILEDLSEQSVTLFRAQAINEGQLLFVGGSYGAGGSQVVYVMVLQRKAGRKNK